MDPYQPPLADVQPSTREQPRKVPGQVKIAILLSWIVFAVQILERLSRLWNDAEVAASLRYGVILIVVTLTSAALVGVSIFLASRGSNLGRIALLLCTLTGWSMWLFYRHPPSEYLSWQWLVYGSLILAELAALVLLFGGEEARLFYARHPH